MPTGGCRCDWPRPRARGCRPRPAHCPWALRRGWSRSARAGSGASSRDGCPGRGVWPRSLGEVGDGPHGVADDRHVRSGERDQLVVGVDRLGLLVGPDGDGGERRDQETRVEHRLHHGEHVGVHGDLLEGGAVDEEVVHPHGADPLEEVVGWDGAEVMLQLEERLVDLVHQLRFDGVGENGVALLGDAGDVLFEVGERVHGGAAFGWASLGVTSHCRDDPGVLSGDGRRVTLGRIGPVVGSSRTGRWRSLVAHLHDTQGVTGSSPVRPTSSEHASQPLERCDSR